MRLKDAVNINDLRAMAKARLPRMAYDYIEGGCDDEYGIAENERSFARHRLLPRYLVDVSQPDSTGTVLGRSYSLPLGLAPTGNAGMFRHEADRLLAAEAAASNVPFILSGASSASIEEIMAVAPDHTWFQLYGTRDDSVCADMIARAKAAGVETLVLSVDVPASANRERNRRSRFTHPLKVSLSMALDALAHPAWCLEYLSNGGLPHMGNFTPYASAGASPARVADFFVEQFPAPALSWDFLKTVRRIWPSRLVVKGLLHPADALRAVEAGANGIIVSNHGGRQLDRAPTALDAFPMVRDAIGGRAELMLDGGIRRGADIAIARCLGASFVFCGRATLYGVAAGGRAGVRLALDMLAREFAIVLAQIGCPRALDLGPDFLVPKPSPSAELRSEPKHSGGSQIDQGAPPSQATA